MKKFLSILVVVGMCLSVGAMLTACGDEEHTHTYKAEWSKDAIHHWHAFEGENCTEVADKEEHTWNGGVITTEATAETDGVKTFTCTACGQTKNEPVEYASNYTVTEEEWMAALSADAFTVDGTLNVTVKYTDVEGETFCYLVNGNHVEAKYSAPLDKELLFVTENFGFEEFCRRDCGNVFEMVDKFSLFSYDEETESYVLYDSSIDDEKYEIAFLDKKLVSCTITVGVGSAYEESWTHTYLNVGTTTMPDGEIAN